jgi:uncharacterized protein YhhL (DUF1145 family)
MIESCDSLYDRVLAIWPVKSRRELALLIYLKLLLHLHELLLLRAKLPSKLPQSVP